ncbi:hypothetical protein SteCoe_8963 [Stentor coeruleus]|uniref:Uncharacterized protein n=1 Tax=Stentor coeruleus TaxID=5963 RepID=A0A1R2CJ30_9CILI|nr:hypothetical protein SteCoe_8963 [Stentor coeruleus]
MESFQKDLLKFFVSYIGSLYEEPELPDKLVRRMMKVKKVQQIIIDCMCRLEPIVAKEISKSRYSALGSSISVKVNESRLIKLSKDVKHLMNNYENIQSKLGSVNNIVNSLDTSLIVTTDIEESDQEKTTESSLVTFLSSIAKKQITTNEEIEEYSSDTWTKHTEVEKLLKNEVEIYSARCNAFENKYYYKVRAIKQKAGIKIKALENQIENISAYYINKITQLGMINEDIKSQQLENFYSEQEILNQAIDFTPASDLLTAGSIIKSLTATRLILEKNRRIDEKIIKGLNIKIIMIGNKYTESQEQCSKLMRYLSSLTWCFGNLIENSRLAPEEKKEVLGLLSDQEYYQIEDKLKSVSFMESYSQENISKKLDNFRESLSVISQTIKNENVKAKLNKMTEDFHLDILKTRPKLNKIILMEDRLEKSPRKYSEKLKVSPKSRSNKSPKYITTPTTRESDKSPFFENSLEIIKKNFLTIEEEIKAKNKALADDLTFFTKSLRSPVKSRNSLENEAISMSKFRSYKNRIEYINKENQTNEGFLSRSWVELSQQTDTKVQVAISTQTDIIKQKVLIVNEQGQYAYTEKELLEEEFYEKKDQQTQTEKSQKRFEYTEIKEPKELNNSILLVRGLMKKSTVPPKTENITVKKHEVGSMIENLISKRLSGLVLPINEINKFNTKSEKYDDKNDENITEEYHKEFNIQSQFFGFKKTSFIEIQRLWEEVINRRLTDGEKDKISVYLRGYLGTDQFDIEKNKIINLLEAAKSDKSINNPFMYLIKEFKTKMSILDNWKRILLKVFFKVSKENADKTNDYSDMVFNSAVLLRFIKNKHISTEGKEGMKKSETSLIFKPDKWIVSSPSPTLISKRIVTSRFLGNNKAKTEINRISKTPTRMSTKHELTRFPLI